MRYNKIIRNILFLGLAAVVFWAGTLASSIWDVPAEVSAVSSDRTSPSSKTMVGVPSFADVVRKEKPAVVNISTTRIIRDRQYGHQQVPLDPFRDFFGDDFFDRFFGQIPRKEHKTQNLGSGFIISKDGYILTNNHVIDNADEIIVRLSNEREFKADIVGRDSKTDVALIKIKDHDSLPVVNIGDSDALEVGEWVIAIGNPFGVGQTVTAGIVSAKGRDIGAGPYDDFIQTDASINPGNSGGPLFNVNGEVVGINTLIYSPSGGNVGIGFAIPINMVKQMLAQLKETGGVTRGWLGVMIQPVTKELADAFDLPSDEGALVADVVGDSPAGRAGIERGDVIIDFDGQKIGKVKELPAIVAETPVDKKVKVRIIRNGKEKLLKVKIEELKDAEKPVKDEIKDLGMSVQNVTPDIARQLDLQTNEGVLITMVERGSSSERGGLVRGDVIIQMNRKDIKDITDYKKVVKKVKKGDRVLVLVVRGANTQYVTIKVD